MRKHTVRVDAGEVTYRGQGMVRSRVFPGRKVTIQDAENFYYAVEVLTRNGFHASMIDISGIKGIDKEVREYMVKRCDEWGKTVCVAFITNSLIARVVGNLFLTVNRPSSCPVRLFTSPFEAQKWAQDQYLKRLAAAA